MADAPPQGWDVANEPFAVAAGFVSWAVWVEHLEVTTKAGKPRARRRKICGARIPRGSDGKTEKDTPCCAIAGSPSTGMKPKETGHLRYGRCGDHGGLSHAGPASASYIHGEHSKFTMRGPLGKMHERMSGQIANQMDLTDQAYVVNLQILRLLDALPDNSVTPSEHIKRMEELLAACHRSLAEKDPGPMIEGTHAMIALLTDHLGETRVLRDLWQVIELKRRLVSTHTQQKAREYGPVDWVDVLTIVAETRQLMAEIIRDHVPQEKQTLAIQMVRSYALPGDRPLQIVG